MTVGHGDQVEARRDQVHVRCVPIAERSQDLGRFLDGVLRHQTC